MQQEKFVDKVINFAPDHQIHFRILENGTIISVCEYYTDLVSGKHCSSAVKASIILCQETADIASNFGTFSGFGVEDFCVLEFLSLTYNNSNIKISNIYDGDELLRGSCELNGLVYERKDPIYPFGNYRTENSSYLLKKYSDYFAGYDDSTSKNKGYVYRHSVQRS